ncbi:T6SS phospholipase effector Tle1-like catalytic domain-containing protein [Pseudomonas sp. NPDC089554]|uniref:T6SS phospholipase effector Tle1-like catalytic domain-containing protein n=1 Tax=Pseudomonas sp. NPDC089554 TaxID=3390653 RepID=UPI003D02B793
MFQQAEQPCPVQPVVVRVGVFFDGSGNNLANSLTAGERTGSYANAPSNVALLHALYRASANGIQGPHGILCFKLYIEGIGTAEGLNDTLHGLVTGRGHTGVEARVRQSMQQLGRQLHAWLGEHPQVELSHIEFDLFGFSRGAAAARHLANDLRKGTGSLLGLALGGRVGLQWQRQLFINFIGLFDTVAAIVAPLAGNFSPANDNYEGLALELDETLASRVVQLVAEDEGRHNFPLVATQWDISLPGAHSDIGGGYRVREQERQFLCKPRSSLVSASTPIERTHAYAEVLELLGGLECASEQIVTWEELLPAAPHTQEEPQKRAYAVLYREREVLGHLSRIYLRIMRQLALDSGVPFAVLDETDPLHALPDELRNISRKLHDYALGLAANGGLTPEEQKLLGARYIHQSAHWNPVKGLRNSELDAFYIDRPAAAGRVVHGVVQGHRT